MIDILDFVNQRVHMIGIGGSSMSGLAEMLQKEGCLVTGSDNTKSHATDRLEAMGIPVSIGHRAENIPGAALVIYYAAISPENPERQEARRLGIPEMERSCLLGQLMRGHRQVICVAGAHGKTTTSSMIGEVFLDAGVDPTIHIGGRVDHFGGGSRVGGKDFFIAEACEYHSSFLDMHPTMAVIMNIDEDHLDYYKDIDDIEHAFGRFLSLLPPGGTALGWGEDMRIRRLFSALPCRTYTFGTAENDDYRAVNARLSEYGCPEYDVQWNGIIIAHIHLRVVGEINLLDSLAAFAAAHLSGLDAETIANALNGFAGVHRRFELTGTVDGVKLYHDYGHNPVEMRTAVASAMLQKAGHVFAVMQPHTYSRVKTLFNDYLECTKAADTTLVTDIFAAREKDPGDIRSEMLVEGMQKHGVNAVLTHTFDDAEAYLRAHWQPGDLVLTMGCGNINLLNEQIQKHGDSPKQ